ncbi:MAG: GSCFA domain-containing protein [Rhodobacteraceae bacterium]|nr:GSCFA domain-containing protein [Paracoccaceae bacterium]
MKNPYQGLQPHAFWKSAVGSVSPFQIGGLWQPKFQVFKTDKIVTAGSCFAQHIGRALAARGYQWFNAEPAPTLMLAKDAEAFNYGIFSFRTGNIYTTRMLRQWIEQAHGLADDPTEVWQKAGRYFDPLRPVIEPQGFASEDELLASRQALYAAIRKAVSKANLIVFTLGLTESWANRESGLEYASCPGTAAGKYDADLHEFRNHRPDAIQADLEAAIGVLRKANPKLKILLTVSPVPLTATASGQHVLPATTYSKSVLRAVAGMVAEDHDFVDYFPSYEIITAPAFRGMFYAPNMRSVVPEGVSFVMQNFFADQKTAFGGQGKPTVKSGAKGSKGDRVTARNQHNDVKCEEELLNAFAS